MCPSFKMFFSNFIAQNVYMYKMCIADYIRQGSTYDGLVRRPRAAAFDGGVHTMAWCTGHGQRQG
jgi:hypothetical protein